MSSKPAIESTFPNCPMEEVKQFEPQQPQPQPQPQPPNTEGIDTIVICGYQLWRNSTNGSIQCMCNFIQKMSIDENPWILIVLNSLEFDRNNNQQCNEKCIVPWKNLKKTIYMQNYEELQYMGELVRYLKAFQTTKPIQLLTVDSDAGHCGWFIKIALQVNKWTHLGTLHLTKNALVLTNAGILEPLKSAVNVNVNNVGQLALDPNFYKKEIFAAQEADEYHTVSNSEKQWVIEVLGRKNKPTANYYPDYSWWWTQRPSLPPVAPPPPPTSFLQTIATPLRANDVHYIRQAYPSHLLVLFVGRITYQKGIHLLLGINWPRNVHFCIMSSTHFGDQKLINQCREYEVNHQDQCTWIGPSYGPERFQVMKNFDAIICPSLYEPYGLVGLETLLFTDSVLITSAVDGMKDYLCQDGYIPCGTTVQSVQSAVNFFAQLSKDEMRQFNVIGKQHVSRLL